MVNKKWMTSPTFKTGLGKTKIKTRSWEEIDAYKESEGGGKRQIGREQRVLG